MRSPDCDAAIRDALSFGRAVLKFISANDLGLTGSKQAGFYMPKEVWEVFSPNPPLKGVNSSHPVTACWPNGSVTSSTVKWYGVRTRGEYRLTRFGRRFEYRRAEHLGSLLAIVPESLRTFRCHVLDSEDDINDFQAELGTEIVGRWALFDSAPATTGSDNECLRKRFLSFASALSAFPSTARFADEARQGLVACASRFLSQPVDQQLVECIEAEYELFKLAERLLCEPLVKQAFASIDDFLATAQTILQRRKARAGASLELHVREILKAAAVPHDFGNAAMVDGTKPDILIPSRRAYQNEDYPPDKLFVLALKTTCKDRWRQVLQEAPRIRNKHILTLQKGISPAQIDEMTAAGVTLIVPDEFHEMYPKNKRERLLTLTQFISEVTARL